MSQKPTSLEFWNLVDDKWGNELLFTSREKAEQHARKVLTGEMIDPDKWEKYFALYRIDFCE